MLELADPDLFLLAGRYTLLEQAPLDTLFPQCEAKGAKIILGGPYNSGVLAGKTTFNYGSIPEDVARRVKSLQAICDTHGVKLRDAALQFVAAHPIVVSVIPGAISPKEIADNVAILEEKIPATLWRDLRAAGLLHDKAPTPAGAV
jgi:D-threo-aldose 1-dehydrogenase